MKQDLFTSDHAAKKNAPCIPVIILVLALPLCLAAILFFTAPTAQAQSNAFDCATVIGIPQDECEALVDFYRSTNGANWIDNTNWLQTPTPCAFILGESQPGGWVGVTCSFGKVFQLELPRNHLQGTLPPSLSKLTLLGTLSLSGNQLSGTIPRTLGSSASLTLLNLSENQLSGPIPGELGNLAGLWTLDVSYNYLSGPIPNELGNLPELQQLYLSDNRLTGTIPATLGKLATLNTLDLSSNQLNGPLPLALTELAHLETLNLLENQLEGSLPAALGNLVSLKSLALGYNRFQGTIPSTLGGLPYLSDLLLNSNKFTGAIPAELGNLTYLQNLVLRDNQLSGPLPAELGNLSELELLLLSYNGISGPIPTSFGKMTHLLELALDYNQLSGPIPLELTNLPSLRVFRLDHNQFSGPLPVELANLENLSWLHLQDNAFTGTIPPELGQLTKLTRLTLGENALTGTIPNTLGNLTELRLLNLRNTKLEGVLPPELGKLIHLRYLYLQNNQLFGGLPLGMVNMFDLQELNVDYNGFFAPLPSLRELLDAKAPGWSATQTLAPSELAADQQSSSAIALTWAPIAYTHDNGFYEVSYSPTADGPFTVHGRTPSKATAAYTVDGLAPATAYYFRIRAHTPAHNDQPNDLWSTYTPVVTATTATPGSGDPFENDNLCTDARILATDGRLLDHTFHTPGDTDWLQFNGQANVTYRIDVQIPAGSAVDAAIALYDQCEGTPVAQQNESFSHGIRLDFRPTASGPLWLQLTNSDPSRGDNNYTYRIAVRALGEETQSGAVILVAGSVAPTDPLQANIYHVADDLYIFFRNNGYSDETIHYLASTTTATLPGVDAAATPVLLRDAIVSWALNKVNPQQALTLYLIGNSRHEDGATVFQLGPNANEMVSAAELDQWLSQLEESIPGVPITVIIEAPYAGGFISGDSSLSKPGRVILTATTNGLRAFASQKGLHFSDQLLTALRQGHHLLSAFWETRTALYLSHQGKGGEFWQEPWLEADGNGVPNQIDDALQASLRGFNGDGNSAPRFWPPTIIDAQLSGETIQAYVDDDGDSPVRVWALFYRAAYAPPTTGSGFIPENAAGDPNLALVELQADGADHYVAGLSALPIDNETSVILYAQDSNGLQARPFNVTGSGSPIGQASHKLYLPLLMR